jgi:polypyrimidine tract-binding protein 1
MSGGNKRNINELYTNGNSGGPVLNGNGLAMNGNNSNNNNNQQLNGIGNNNDSQQYSDSEQKPDVKKSRLDTNQQTSRVVHVRGIPQQLTDNEIIYIGLNFGPVSNVLFLRSKGQAFLQFEDMQDAQKMIDHFQSSLQTFHTKKLYIQYSMHQELNTDPNNSNNQIAQAALQEACTMYRSAKQGGKNTVLRLTVLNMMYPVTLDVLNQIFTKFGQILKIITFTKNEKFQALIQMKDALSAQNAKNSLNGQNIYNGCCTLQIEYSKLNALEVKLNNEKSRDYTNLLLAGGDGNQNDSMLNGSSQNSSQNSNGGGFGLLNQPPGGPGGHNGNLGGANQNLLNAVSQFTFGNLTGFNPNPFQMNHQNQQQLMGNNQQMNQNGNNNSDMTPVVLVTNLNEENATPDALFTLFGVYGDVSRVKVLFNKKDSALIMFTNSMHAQTALNNLDRVKLWGKQIRVFPSKHTAVQMPKDGQPDAGLTKDFTQSALHRFKKPGSKNFNNIFPPSPTLHLSNIPANISEQQLKDLFAEHGTIKAFRFFQKDRKMALMQMQSTEEALQALIALHNHQLADNMHLRVAFSKANV